MAEYLQDIQERAQATISAWGTSFDGLTLGATTLAVFEGETEALPGLSQSRDNATQALDEARQARDDSSRIIKSAGIRVPEDHRGAAGSGERPDRRSGQGVCHPAMVAEERPVPRADAAAGVEGGEHLAALSRASPGADPFRLRRCGGFRRQAGRLRIADAGGEGQGAG